VFVSRRTDGLGWEVFYRGGTSQGKQHIAFAQSARHGKLLAQVMRRNPLQYRTVETRTLKGLKEAERLQAAGWKIIRSGMFSIQFERKVARRRTAQRRARRNWTAGITSGNLKSESKVIGEQLNVLRSVHRYLEKQGARGIAADVAGAIYALDELRGQAALGFHKNRARRNPLLGIFGPNPRAKVVREMGRVVEVRYKRKDDGGLYYHKYTSKPRLLALSDGSIWIKGA